MTRATLLALAERPAFKVHTARLLAEVLENPSCAVLRQPLLIFDGLLREVASRAAELHDPVLDGLMVKLTLYAVADPYGPDFDAAICADVVAAACRAIAEERKP